MRVAAPANRSDPTVVMAANLTLPLMSFHWRLNQFVEVVVFEFAVCESFTDKQSSSIVRLLLHLKAIGSDTA